jgi:hypothetical protein
MAECSRKARTATEADGREADGREADGREADGRESAKPVPS